MSVNAPSRNSSSRRAGSSRTEKPQNKPVPTTKSPARRPNRDSVELSPEVKPEKEKSTVGGLLDSLSDWAGFGDKAQESSTADPTKAAANPSKSGLELDNNELLSRGRNSDAEKVTQLQEMLNERGLDIAVDGKFGPETEQAVLEFQRQQGLEKIDGIVGPETLGALNGSSPVSETEEEAPSVDSPDQVATPGLDSKAPTLDGLPPRAEDAMGGKEFLESLKGLDGDARAERILAEVMSGNIPENSRHLKEVVVNRNGKELKMHVMPDYLSIGSNQDNVRVPMTPEVALAIAERTGTSLPTPTMVNDIHEQSQKLSMPTFDSNRSSINTYLQHDQRVDSMLGSGQAQTDLVSGHKKDLVIPINDGRVAIYGGRWGNDGLIQEYSNVHGADYEDYSHGVRLVSENVFVDGQQMKLSEVLANPDLSGLFLDPADLR